MYLIFISSILHIIYIFVFIISVIFYLVKVTILLFTTKAAIVYRYLIKSGTAFDSVSTAEHLKSNTQVPHTETDTAFKNQPQNQNNPHAGHFGFLNSF